MVKGWPVLTFPTGRQVTRSSVRTSRCARCQIGRRPGEDSKTDEQIATCSVAYMHFPPKPCAEWHSLEAEPAAASAQIVETYNPHIDSGSTHCTTMAHNEGPAAQPVSGS